MMEKNLDETSHATPALDGSGPETGPEIGPETGPEIGPENCDREPIHIPGTVQPFGALLAFDHSVGDILYASANVGELFDGGVDRVVNSTMTELLGDEVFHDVRNTLATGSPKDQRERVGRFPIGELGDVDLFAHLNADGLTILELEPQVSRHNSKERASPIDRARMALSRAGNAQSLEQMLEIAAIGLKSVCDYDRVKAYRYLSDGSGEVVAEALNAGVDSFLGLRYPAWDVPKQARALQVRCPLRMIVDVRQEPVKLMARAGVTKPLDMSLAQLRGISPIHVEYLHNMGVAATLTIALVVDGDLWGMLSCHNLTPRVLPADARIAAEIFGQMLSLLIKERLQKNDTAAKLRASRARQRILAETDSVPDFSTDFDAVAPILTDVLPCDGLAIIDETEAHLYGSCPTNALVSKLTELRSGEDDLIAQTENLMASGWLPELSTTEGDNQVALGDTAGAIIIRTPAAKPLHLLFFRNSTVKSIHWAGQPNKLLEDSKFGPRISPRKSFARYVEEHRDSSEPWLPSDLAAAKELQGTLTQIALKNNRALLETHSITLKYQRQQDLLIAELNHRVRNILALIRSVSRQAKESSDSLESYARALEQRIAALAAAHDLAVDGTMKGVALRRLLMTEVAPYHREADCQVLIAGDHVGLRADVAPIVTLVIHEMVTNAAKHGSLSSSEGLVRMRWTRDEQGLSFSWQELGGPQVSLPSRTGFGRSLVEKAIPYEFGGKSELRFDESGVTFTFWLADEFLTELNEDQADSDLAIPGPITKTPRPATGKRALLLEDNLVLSMDMTESLSRLGTEEVLTASTIEQARRLLKRQSVDFAVLDMNLRGEFSFELAEDLSEAGVPFLFVSGYGSSAPLPNALDWCIVLSKPVDELSLARSITDILKKST